jgi:hypothetical protein
MQTSLPFCTPAGHLLLYWLHKDFTQWFLKFHDSTKEPVLRVSVPHMRFLIVADPAITQNILGKVWCCCKCCS